MRPVNITGVAVDSFSRNLRYSEIAINTEMTLAISEHLRSRSIKNKLGIATEAVRSLFDQLTCILNQFTNSIKFRLLFIQKLWHSGFSEPLQHSRFETPRVPNNFRAATWTWSPRLALRNFQSARLFQNFPRSVICGNFVELLEENLVLRWLPLPGRTF